MLTSRKAITSFYFGTARVAKPIPSRLPSANKRHGSCHIGKPVNLSGSDHSRLLVQTCSDPKGQRANLAEPQSSGMGLPVILHHKKTASCFRPCHNVVATVSLNQQVQILPTINTVLQKMSNTTIH